MEDNPLFNAGKGAALTMSGGVECDASVMTGDGAAGAVTACTRIKNPIRLARVVKEHTPHVLLINPDVDLATSHGIDVVDPEYFVTPARQEQLRRILAEEEAPLRHGTVGAVALDSHGHLAAATSTGGISKQFNGRVGDSPIIGAGTFARDGACALSCTGDGEAFLEGCVAHDIYARMAFGRLNLAEAIHATFDEEITRRGSTGGVIGIDAEGQVVLAHNSEMMFAACKNGVRIEVWT
ncbi:Isoaspartyl peptidase [Platysternon megacephalum]|uniref:Isoaspartyl peptidase/L-asparaginase n=1 Tax=Platysternon megacephalum TaxID=55544 RepID=A0A4D9DI23_9SAUR|nr:Isoaspartyl peptidase [Platysternon megacephalum]